MYESMLCVLHGAQIELGEELGGDVETYFNISQKLVFKKCKDKKTTL